MRKTLAYAAILAAIFLAGCQAVETQTKPSEPPFKNAETKSTVSITIEPSAGTPVSTGEPSAWTAEEGDPGAENPPYVNIYFVELESKEKSAVLMGCGDRIVGAQVKYGLTKDINTTRGALEMLFAVKDQFYGEDKLYNSLYGSDLEFDSLTVDKNKKATLKLTGNININGVCDTPRFEEQIRQTVLQFKDLYSDVEIFVNDKPLKEIFSGRGESDEPKTQADL